MSAPIEKLVSELIMNDDVQTKENIAEKIWVMAQGKGIYPASIHDFYAARGNSKFSGVTVPAMNLRTLTYDTARAIFRSAKKINAGAFIFEIAKSEMGYTSQSPVEYTAFCLAAAIKEGYQGPVFIQGDHIQVNAKKFAENKEKELSTLKQLISDAIKSGFYNIDIDSSTLVDLKNADLYEQQRNNFEICAELTRHIREIQPKGINVSVGGEIGEVGGKNSTPEDLEAFMKGYLENIPQKAAGISKISIQTGTAHGGVVLPDGSIAKVKLDFDTLKNVSKIARDKFGLAGAVQHGASTLPDEAFHKFAENETAEVHLATQFQNMVYESKYFPAKLKEKIYSWIKKELAGERKTTETDEQFIYSARKKALGPFKKEIFNIEAKNKEEIGKGLEHKFDFLFKELKIAQSKPLIDKFIKPQKIGFTSSKTDFSKKDASDFEGAD